MRFTAEDAQELHRILAEQGDARTSAVEGRLRPGEMWLPGFDHTPRSLEPIEADARYQALMSRWQPVQDELVASQDEYRNYITERDAGVPPGRLSQSQLDANQRRQ